MYFHSFVVVVGVCVCVHVHMYICNKLDMLLCVCACSCLELHFWMFHTVHMWRPEHQLWVSSLVFLFSLRQAVLAAVYAELTGKQGVGEHPASASHIPRKIMCALLHLAFKCILIIGTQVINPCHRFFSVSHQRSSYYFYQVRRNWILFTVFQGCLLNASRALLF